MVSLAISIASASVSYGMIDSTGPKISSRAMVMSRVTPENTVGCTKKPRSSPSGVVGPPATSVAPSSMPIWMKSCTRSRWAADTSGPRRLVCSNGSPVVKAAAVAAAICSASARRSRGTSMRVSAVQVWPELRKHLPTPSATAFVKSASSRMTFGLLPPSSRATFFTVCDATSATRLPARVEPVKLTMSTSACAAMASPTTGPTPVTRLKTPAGRPASWMTSARMKALIGATSLGFSTTVLPAASAGATFSAIWCSG